MRTLKLTLAYDGTDFHGWQVQPNTRTVQGELERVLLTVTGQPIEAIGSSRTDAGVHALGQVASITTEVDWTPAAFRRALGSKMPPDLAVLSVEDVAEDFHARRSAQRKRYRYVLELGEAPNVLLRRFAWHCRGQLDVPAMQAAAARLIGKHDFASFQTAGSPRQSTVRTVYDVTVSAPAGDSSFHTGLFNTGERLIVIEAEANGFLYNMVRAFVGTLIIVGRGKCPPEWINQLLATPDRSLAGPTAPPQGLFLLRVMY